MPRHQTVASILVAALVMAACGKKPADTAPPRGRGPHHHRRPHRHDGRRPAHHRRSDRRGRRQDHFRRQQGGRARAAGRRHGAEGPRRQDADARVHRWPCPRPAVRHAGRRRQPARSAGRYRQYDRRPRGQAEDLRRRAGRRPDRVDLRHGLRRRTARPPSDPRGSRQGVDHGSGDGHAHLGPFRRGQHARPEDDRLRRRHARPGRRCHPPRGRRQDSERRARGTGRHSPHGQVPDAGDTGREGRVPEARHGDGQELRLYHRERGPHVRADARRHGGCRQARAGRHRFHRLDGLHGPVRARYRVQHDVFEPLSARWPQGHARWLAAGPHGLAHRALPDPARWPEARLQGLSRHSRHEAGRGLLR